MRDKHLITEEPCNGKLLSTVLETSGSREGLTEFNFTGIAVQSAKFTLLTTKLASEKRGALIALSPRPKRTRSASENKLSILMRAPLFSKFCLRAHLVLPFKTVKERMEQRRMMRRGKRGRRINRKIDFKKRAHRQKRFNNRRVRKVPPSIKANRQLELRVIKEIKLLYPITSAVYEVVKARGDKGFSPVMVGQKWMLRCLEGITSVFTKEGWETSNMREHLKLTKQKHSKGDAIPATHAIDGIALASSQFTEYRKWYGDKLRGAKWFGSVQLTRAPFVVIRRPPICRRQLHLMLPIKGGTRRKYGGTITRHGVRKGDYVKTEQAGRIYYGWVSGDTEKQISVSDIRWKRLGQFTAKKVHLIQRSNGLLVEKQGYFQAG